MVRMNRLYRINAPRRKTHRLHGTVQILDRERNLVFLKLVKSGKAYWYSNDSLVSV